MAKAFLITVPDEWPIEETAKKKGYKNRQEYVRGLIRRDVFTNGTK